MSSAFFIIDSDRERGTRTLRPVIHSLSLINNLKP